ncbi:hypothetical protein EMCRGX_G018696 [Ephydatia muelleri]
MLAVGLTSTYIALSLGAIMDRAGNPIQQTAIIPVVNYKADTVRPSIVSFGLDMNTGTLVISFSKIVTAPTGFDPTAISFYSNQSAMISIYKLVGGLPISTSNESISIAISMQDLNTLKSIPNLAHTLNGTYITAATGLASDLNGLTMVALTVPMKASYFVPDTTPPTLQAFTFALGNGTLSLVFSEYVVTSRFVATAITLQSSAGTPSTSLKLSGGSLLPSQSLQVLVVKLLDSDLNILKAGQSIALNNDTTYLAATSMTVVDGFNLSLVPILTSNALPASQYLPDLVPPTLANFTFDRNTGVLMLTFSEAVNSSTFDVTMIVLAGSGSGGSMYTLLDENNNVLAGSQPIQAFGFIPDTNRPLVISFALDLNSNVLTLSFNETVDASTINPSNIYIQPAANSSALVSLTGSTVNSTSGQVQSLIIGFTALNSIKAVPSLASLAFLSLTSAALNDTSANRVIAINSTSALRTNSVITKDTTPPSLNGVAFDLNTGALIFTFSEIVDFNSINYTAITLLPRCQSVQADRRLT